MSFSMECRRNTGRREDVIGLLLSLAMKQALSPHEVREVRDDARQAAHILSTILSIGYGHCRHGRHTIFAFRRATGAAGCNAADGETRT